MPSGWTIQDSIDAYQIDRWGNPFFTINPHGHLAVDLNQKTPGDHGRNSVDLLEIIDEVKKSGVKMPLVIRFHDILRHQVKALNLEFREKIEEFSYQGEYFGVYPIKVNQMREVVEEIVEAGREFKFGLEAGSKSELLAILSQKTHPEALHILNGHKDHDSIRLAMMATKMGKNMFIVVEKLSELELILGLSKDLSVKPLIGIRGKLSVQGSGKWASSCGNLSKFGLSIPEILSATKLLADANMLDQLQLFHFHIGSQVSDIQCIKDCLSEAARIYAKLYQMGAPIKYFDVGGGLGVNYEGDFQQSSLSINYNQKEYISDVVYIVKQVCDVEKVPHPNLVSESGRAITAHHSCIVTNVFDRVNAPHNNPSFRRDESDHLLLKNMFDIYEETTKRQLREAYYDAKNCLEDAISAFKLGVLSLEQRGKIEKLFNLIIQKIARLNRVKDRPLQETPEINQSITQQYLCNFSVFQSVPDAWGIGQVLPVAPLGQHKQEPDQICFIGDITCDSDGKINQFVTSDGVQSTFKLHTPPAETDEYYIGIFLTGAYQDIMGDMHNLFGRLNEIHVYSDTKDPRGYYIEEYVRGNNCREILKTLQYSPVEMARSIKTQIDQQIKDGHIRSREGVELIDYYENQLASYTYLSKTNL
jgi:arginine decarboxylase